MEDTSEAPDPAASGAVNGRPLHAAPDPAPAAGDSAETEGAPCRFCETVWGVAGLLIAAALGFVALDLLTGGRLTGSVTGGSLPGTPGE